MPHKPFLPFRSVPPEQLPIGLPRSRRDRSSIRAKLADLGSAQLDWKITTGRGADGRAPRLNRIQIGCDVCAWTQVAMRPSMQGMLFAIQAVSADGTPASIDTQKGVM